MPKDLARAKVNLCLHVTGQRDDGLHLLDSIVVFPEIGDVIEVSPAGNLSLNIDGPFGTGLDAGEDNLIIRAARLLGVDAEIHLQKNLPLASGIGGGSADAATAIRLLCELHGVALPTSNELLTLGADVPVCMAQQPVRMRGVGQELTPLPDLPNFWIILVNAGEGVETALVFKAMVKRDNAEISALPEGFANCAELFTYLCDQRNDMEDAATKISPVIEQVLAVLSDSKDCALARMSGSGGTCFGLFSNDHSAKAAVVKLRAAQPDWWVQAAQV